MENNEKLYFNMPEMPASAIKVIGVGGGGTNAVKYMHSQGITGVDFVVCNTDAQALSSSPIKTKIQLGTTITEGLGAGADPEVGEKSAMESIEDIKAVLGSNTKMVFITAGMGGGTGTGAAPVIASIAKEMGILTVGIVTVPFSFEGKARLDQAGRGLEKMRNSVDSLIVVKNDKLREIYGNLGFKTGFSKADEILNTAAKGIAEVITKEYQINIDLRDAKTVLSNSGTAIMGSARASGTNKAQDAVVSALDSPLLNDNKIEGATNVLLLIVYGSDEVTVDEVGVINDYIQQQAGNATNIIMGVGEDESLGEDVSVTVIATGFPVDDQRNSGRPAEKVYHTLKDEEFHSKPISMKIAGAFSDDASNNEIKEEPSYDDGTIKKFVLEDEEESSEFGISNKTNFNTTGSGNSIGSEDDGIILVKKDTPSINTSSSSLFSNNELPQEDKPTNTVAEPRVFTLDEVSEVHNIVAETSSAIQISEVEQVVAVEVEQELQEEESIEESELSMQDAMERRIQERRKKLKELNSQYQLRSAVVDNMEKTPAYERFGAELDENKEGNTSSSFYNGKTNEVEVKPNNFLHDNVD